MQKRFRSSISSVFDESRDLDRYLDNGWQVVVCSQLDERTLEYIIEQEDWKTDWEFTDFDEEDDE